MNIPISKKFLNKRFSFFLLCNIILLLIIFMIHVGLGSTFFSFSEIIAVFLNHPVEEYHRTIIMQTRLPRALIATLAGGMLGLAGAIMQSITRNPLAEPGLTGVTSGSVMVAVLFITFSNGFTYHVFLLPLVALIGGVTAALFTYGLSLKAKANPFILVLNGVVLSAIFSSVTSLMLLLNQERLGSILLWIIGSLNARVWEHWQIIWPWAIVAIPLGLLSSRYANILQLGDEVASGLGLKVETTRLALLSIAALLTASSVAVVGAIGFIGLIGPNIARRLVGEDTRRIFPISFLLTANLLLLADIIAQNINLDIFVQIQKSGGGLPVGAVTVLIGTPFFLHIIKKTEK